VSRGRHQHTSCGCRLDVGQVVETVGKQFPDVVFTYQHEQKGTGHAAQVGAQALRKFGYQGAVLLTMGDKVMEPPVLKALIEYFRRTEADLCFLTALRGASDGAGRILTDGSDRVVANLEVFDINKARWFGELERLCHHRRQIAASTILNAGRKYFSSESKLKLAAGPLWICRRRADRYPADGYGICSAKNRAASRWADNT